MKTITTIEELMKTIKENGNCGLRGASEHDLQLINDGYNYLDCSQDLYNERDCDYDENASYLPGTSAISAVIVWDVDDEDDIANITERLSEAKGYAGYHHQTDVVLLITGDDERYGVDPNEVVLGYQYGDDYCGAKILAKVEIA